MLQLALLQAKGSEGELLRSADQILPPARPLLSLLSFRSIKRPAFPSSYTLLVCQPKGAAAADFNYCCYTHQTSSIVHNVH